MVDPAQGPDIKSLAIPDTFGEEVVSRTEPLRATWCIYSAMRMVAKRMYLHGKHGRREWTHTVSDG